MNDTQLASLAAIVSILTVLGNLLLGFAALQRDKRRDEIAKKSSDAEQAHQISEAWKPYVDELKAQNKEMAEQLDRLEKRDNERDRLFKVAVRGVRILIHQLDQNRITPAWEIPSELEAYISSDV